MLGCFSCRNKTAHTGGGGAYTTEIVSSHGPEDWRSKTRVPAGWCLLRPLSPERADGCLLAGSSRGLSFVCPSLASLLLLRRTPVVLDEGPAPGTSFNLNYLFCEAMSK